MSAKDMQRRIDNLVKIIPIGCKTCREWTSIAIIDDDGNSTQPRHCPVCGRHVTTTWVHIVGVPLDCI